jgi:hypothetical protein
MVGTGEGPPRKEHIWLYCTVNGDPFCPFNSYLALPTGGIPHGRAEDRVHEVEGLRIQPLKKEEYSTCVRRSSYRLALPDTLEYLQFCFTVCPALFTQKPPS